MEGYLHKKYITELRAAQNNIFPCNVRIIYHNTGSHAPEGSNANTQRRKENLKRVKEFTINFRRYKGSLLSHIAAHVFEGLVYRQ
jgi:hypothetical protein